LPGVVGRGLGLAAVCAAALICAMPAGAHTDGVRQIALEWPAHGVVTRGWGWDGPEFHKGIDVGTLSSLAIRAAAPGRVEEVGYATGFEGYGNIVLVDLGSGFEALYAHLSDVKVARGDVVAPGQLLGLAGCTGWCTGTHLHFEVREDGAAIDPAPLLPATIPAPEGG
jgi:murein DD-endopeptidase MepM/ murein hydrolase activator NlpD